MTEKLIGGRAVVLLEPERNESKPVTKVLRSIVSRVEVVASVDELSADLDWNEIDLVIANYDLLDGPSRERLVTACDLTRHPGRLLVYSSRGGHDDLITLFGELGLMNLLAKNPRVDPEELFVTIKKLLSKDIFGIEKYFPLGTPIQSVTVTSSSGLEDVLSLSRDFGASIETNSRLLGRFATVAEELVLNALYTAPVDEFGRPRFSMLSRAEPVRLDAAEAIEVQVASDGRRLGVAVRDPFGSLTVDAVLKYLVKCFRRGPDQVNTKEGGAGLGLYYVFESLSHFIINLRRQKQTEIIGLMDIRGSYRDLLERGKSFNIFLSDTEESGDESERPRVTR